MKHLFLAATVMVASWSVAPSASAEEKNGLSVSVTKRTLNRSDRRDSAYYTTYNRTQGYKLNIKNVSMKPMADGEVTWTILVQKAGYNRADKYTGTEPLKALKSSEAVEILVGAVPIAGYRYERDYKDEMDYEVVVTHAGKETIRLASMANFAAVSRSATPMEGENEDGTRRRRDGEVPATPAAEPATPGAVAPMPPTARPPVAPVPPNPFSGSTPGAAPATPPAPVTPATPAKVAPAPAAAENAAPAQSFDFFNLKKK